MEGVRRAIRMPQRFARESVLFSETGHQFDVGI